MRIRFRDAIVWRYAFVAISKIIEEATLNFSPNGLKLRAMDPSAVALIDLAIPVESFTEFDIPGEVNIGLNMEEFAKVLKRARKGDELVLEIGERKISVIFEGKGIRRFTIPSIETTLQEIPEISFEVAFRGKILPKVFKDVVRELEPISDVIEFHVPGDGDKLIIRASSEIGNAELELSTSSGSLLECEILGEASSKYTLDYLIDISTASQVSEFLLMEFGNETPIRLVYELPNGGKLEFYVAPRTD
ncbi:MAG: DNA polymerase sliding clamp [Desulfurococcaceae archaeon]